MSKTILGRKIGMTQIFTEGGDRIPVTVVQAGPMVVVAKKSAEGNDGYNAVKLGFEKADKQEKDGNVRYRGVNKAEAGVFLKAGLEPHRTVIEVRVSEKELANYEVGQEISFDIFNSGDIIDVTGTSKGRGFAGVMKRHNFAGFKASHGVHESFRGGGSIGASAYPARVFKGQKMAGRYGGKKVTTQNLELVRVMEEDGLYLIKGAVPGPINGVVKIQKAVKLHGA